MLRKTFLGIILAALAGCADGKIDLTPKVKTKIEKELDRLHDKHPFNIVEDRDLRRGGVVVYASLIDESSVWKSSGDRQTEKLVARYSSDEVLPDLVALMRPGVRRRR